MISYTELISSWFKRFLMSLKNLTYLSFLLNTYNFKTLSLCPASIVTSISKTRNSVFLRITIMFISSGLSHRFSRTKFTFALLFQSTLNITTVVSAKLLLHSYFRWSSRWTSVRNEIMHFSFIRWFRVLITLTRTLSPLTFKTAIFISFN